MSLDLLPALVVFAVVVMVSPGPNNVLMLASGVNFGLRRSLPPLLGICFGIAVMSVAVGVGLGELFRAHPALYGVMRWVAVAFLLYLAWTTARSGATKAADGGGATDRPPGFLALIALQWTNPISWVGVLGAIGTYVPRDGYLLNVLLAAGVFGLVSFPCAGVWAAFGTAIRGFLGTPGRARVFNVSMALLLVLSLYPILAESVG